MCAPYNTENSDSSAGPGLFKGSGMYIPLILSLCMYCWVSPHVLCIPPRFQFRSPKTFRLQYIALVWILSNFWLHQSVELMLWLNELKLPPPILIYTLSMPQRFDEQQQKNQFYELNSTRNTHLLLWNWIAYNSLFPRHSFRGGWGGPQISATFWQSCELTF